MGGVARTTGPETQIQQTQDVSLVPWLEPLLGALLGATLPVMFLARLGPATFNVAVADAVVVIALAAIGLQLVSAARLRDLLRPLAAALGLFFGWLVLMSLASLLRYDASGLDAGRELFKYVVDLVWLVACALLFSNRRSRDAFLAVWFFTALAISVATLVVRFEAWPRFVRPEVTFQHPNALANYLGASLGAAWWMTRGRLKWLGWAGLTLILSAVLFSTSRGGLLASLATLAWIGANVTILRRGFNLRPLVAGGVVAVLLAAFLFLTPPGQAVTGKLVGERHLGSVDDRLELWSDSLHFYRESPWLGMGPGMFAVLREDVLGKRGIIAHNEYLTALTEQGPVGLAAILFLLGSTLWVSVKVAPRVPWAIVGSAAVVHSAAHGFVSNVFQLRVLWVGMAVVLAGALMSREPGIDRGAGQTTR